MKTPLSYDQYIDLQMNTYKSHELTVPRWEEGQQKYIELEFGKVDKHLNILDISCGDGVGLRQFKKLNFVNVTGFEYEAEKAEFAKQSGYPVQQGDFHDISIFPDNSFDIVYSSHSLEHALYPAKVLEGFMRVLKPNGQFFLVLPFPDRGAPDAHVAKFELGTEFNDAGIKVVSYISSFGFNLIDKKFDSFREPEIWLKFTKSL